MLHANADWQEVSIYEFIQPGAICIIDASVTKDLTREYSTWYFPYSMYQKKYTRDCCALFHIKYLPVYIGLILIGIGCSSRNPEG